MHFVCSAPGADSLPRHVIKNALKCLRCEHENNFPAPRSLPPFPLRASHPSPPSSLQHNKNCQQLQLLPPKGCALRRVLAKCIACLGSSREAPLGRGRAASPTKRPKPTATKQNNNNSSSNTEGQLESKRISGYENQSKCGTTTGLGRAGRLVTWSIE